MTLLKGTLTVEEKGKPTQTLATGQVYEEPIGSPHRSSWCFRCRTRASP
jgi:quercetin dioxygenase-like cupin family protein